MIDPGVFYTIWSVMGSTITGSVYWVYTKYNATLLALADRPTKEEIQAMFDHEDEKMDPRLLSIEKSIQDLHGDVQLLLNYILNAKRTPEKDGNPTSPTSLH